MDTKPKAIFFDMDNTLLDHRRAARETLSIIYEKYRLEGYGVERRFRYLLVGTATREDADALAARLHGSVEPGGELVWETVPGNPFSVFGGLGGSGTPIG